MQWTSDILSVYQWLQDHSGGMGSGVLLSQKKKKPHNNQIRNKPPLNCEWLRKVFQRWKDKFLPIIVSDEPHSKYLSCFEIITDSVMLSGSTRHLELLFIFVASFLKGKKEVSVMSDSLQPHRLWPARLLCPWGSPGKNTGVGCHSFLQGLFPTQGSNQ